MGDSVKSPSLRSTTSTSRVVIAKTPLPFWQEIFCQQGFLGETGDSGHVTGLDEDSKKREIMDDSRTILRREIAHDSDSGSGPKIG